jgi:acetyltransferase-like isoleucine patch superfamily enzyme
VTTTPEAIALVEDVQQMLSASGIPWNAIAAEIGEHTICHAGKPLIFGGAKIGDYCKIQNLSIIGPGVTLEDGVFIGPGVTFTNDRVPRAINPDGRLKEGADWTCEKTLVKYGASVGAGSTICPGVTIGEWAMVLAGCVVARDVPAYAKVFGSPARVVGWVDETGAPISKEERDALFMRGLRKEQ